MISQLYLLIYFEPDEVIVITTARILSRGGINPSYSPATPKAKVTVTGKSGADLAKNVKRSGKQGIVTKDILADGEYDYEVEYNGCVKETDSFFVNGGVTTKVVVRMKKVHREELLVMSYK